MAKQRHTPDQIVAKLREAEVELTTRHGRYNTRALRRALRIGAVITFVEPAVGWTLR